MLILTGADGKRYYPVFYRKGEGITQDMCCKCDIQRQCNDRGLSGFFNDNDITGKLYRYMESLGHPKDGPERHDFYMLLHVELLEEGL